MPSPANPPPLITACMIVRDEAAHLPDCLASLRGLTDDIVVVDTGSTDGSPEVARRLGAAVLVTAAVMLYQWSKPAS